MSSKYEAASGITIKLPTTVEEITFNLTQFHWDQILYILHNYFIYMKYIFKNLEDDMI